MKSKRLALRVEENLVDILERVAREEGSSASEIVRQALLKYLKQRVKKISCYDLARATGLIGSAENLPRDLSKNRRHFQGFAL